MKVTQQSSNLFLAGITSLLLGVVCRVFFVENVHFLLCAVLLVGSASSVVFWGKKWVVYLLMFILLFSLGLWKSDHDLNTAQNSLLAGSELTARGYVSQEPQRSLYSTRLTITLGDCDEAYEYCSGGRVLVWGNVWEEYGYGDTMELSCVLKVPENFSPDFDWRMYLAKSGIMYECEKVHSTKLAERSGNVLYAKLLHFREAMEKNVNAVIPQPEAGLANGLLFGGSDRLSDEMQEDFSKTSMTHIVAVSGYNVSILSYYFLFLGIIIGLRRQQAFWFAVLGIVLFVLMIGFPPSAIRAGIMGVLLLWAMKQGMLGNSLRALLFAAAIMLFWNPMLLRFDIGFQLSFLATLGIILLAPYWEEFRLLRGKSFGLLDILYVTIVAQIFVLPIVLYHFHQFSPVAFLANLLILGVVPLTMLFIFFAAVGGFIFIGLSEVFGWIAYFMLAYAIFIVRKLAEVSFLQFTFPDFSLTHLVMWYIVLLGGVVYLHRRRKHKIRSVCKRYEHS